MKVNNIFFSTRNKDDNHGDDDDGYGHIMIMMNIIKIKFFFICKKFIYPIFVWSLNFQLNHQCECDSYKWFWWWWWLVSTTWNLLTKFVNRNKNLPSSLSFHTRQKFYLPKKKLIQSKWLRSKKKKKNSMWSWNHNNNHRKRKKVVNQNNTHTHTLSSSKIGKKKQ